MAKTNKYKVMATTNPIFRASGPQDDAETSSFETDQVAPVRSVDRVKSIEEDPNVATIFSCFVNLCNTILGSGLLGLPYGEILYTPPSPSCKIITPLLYACSVLEGWLGDRDHLANSVW